MVQSAARTVDDWMAELDTERRPAFEQFRALCLSELNGWQERMQWGMPGYGPPGKDSAVSFNAQKNHIAFYAGETAIARAGDRLNGVDCGKGCVRYRRPSQIDFDVVRDMLRDIASR